MTPVQRLRPKPLDAFSEIAGIRSNAERAFLARIRHKYF
jgi:hypothetical protein